MVASALSKLPPAIALMAALVLSSSAVQAQHEALTRTPTPAVKLPRVASINLCTDQLLLLLAEPEQILALSTLSRDSNGSYFFEQAKQHPQVNAVAEDLLLLKPDLVLAGEFASRYTMDLLEELDIRVETLPIANSIEDMLSNVQAAGELLLQNDRAAEITQQVEDKLAVISRQVNTLDRHNWPTAAVYDTNGYTVGASTLRGQAMELAGWSNVATDKGIDSYGVLGLEQLIELRPQALIESPYAAEHYSRGQMLTKHPAIRAAGLDPVVIDIPSNTTICAGPWTVDVIQRLVDAKDAL